MMSIACHDPKQAGVYDVTVLECGHPWDTYQAVYGQSYNWEMLRLVRMNSSDG